MSKYLLDKRFTKNKYYQWYCSLVERGRKRQLNGYKETHHILPRCMGGPDNSENLVDLTGREHFLAHLLLVKFTDEPKLRKSLWGFRRRGANSRLFEIAARLHGEEMRRQNTGHVVTDEVRRKISLAHTGKRLSEETKRKISRVRKGKKLPEQWARNIAKGKLGKVRGPNKTKKDMRYCTEEFRSRMSKKLKGKPLSISHKKALKEAWKKRKEKGLLPWNVKRDRPASPHPSSV